MLSTKILPLKSAGQMLQTAAQPHSQAFHSTRPSHNDAGGQVQ